MHKFGDCSFCRGEVKEGRVEMDYRYKGKLYIFQNVPAGVCQQCGEKYLKAFLIFHGKEVPRTHSIAALLSECIEIDGDFQALGEIGADKLTDFAVDIRYGDEFYLPSDQETIEAIETARKVKDFVLRLCITKVNDPEHYRTPN